MIHRNPPVYMMGATPRIMEGMTAADTTVPAADATDVAPADTTTPTTDTTVPAADTTAATKPTPPPEIEQAKTQAAEVKAYVISVGNDLKSMLGKVNAPYVLIKYIISLISEGLVYGLSMGQAGEDDRTIVTGQIETVVGVALSIWIAYNWFFILLCTNSKLFAPEPIKLYTIDPGNLGNNIVTYLFRHITIPLCIVQNLIQIYGKYGFEWISRKFSKHLTMIVMFGLITHLVHSMGDKIVDGFFNALQCKYDAYLGLWAAMIIAYSLYKTFYVDLEIPVIGEYINPIASSVNMYMVFASPLSLFFSLIVFCLRLGGALAAGFITSLLVNGYIIAMSLRAISIYKAGTTSTTEVLKKMHEFIMNEKRDPSSAAPPGESIGEYIFQASEDEKDTIKYKLTKFMYWIVVYMYLFMIELAFIGCLLKSTKIYNYEIKHSGLRVGLISIAVAIILLLCTNIGMSVLYRFYEASLKDKAKSIDIGDVSNAAIVIAEPIQNDAKYADGSLAGKVSDTAAMLRKKLSPSTDSAVSTSSTPGGIFSKLTSSITSGLADKSGTGSKGTGSLISGLADKLIPGVAAKIDTTMPTIVPPIATPVALTPAMSAATNTSPAITATAATAMSSATNAAKESATSALKTGVSSLMSGLLKR